MSEPLDPVFTPALKLRFLDELSQHGNVRVAAARVGVSRSGLYLVRRRDAFFAAGWLAALREARWHAEAVLAERALDGVEEPVFYRGEVIAVRRRYDTRLLLAHLARLDALCAAPGDAVPLDGTPSERVSFDGALALAAGLEVAVPPPDRAAHLDAVAEAAGAAFDESEQPPCSDAIEAELAGELDQLGDEAAIEARIDEAYDAAERAYYAARADRMGAAVTRAAALWDERQAELLSEVDALRGEPPLEVKGMPGSPQAPKLPRGAAAHARRTGRFGTLGGSFAARPQRQQIALPEPCPLCPASPLAAPGMAG